LSSDPTPPNAAPPRRPTARLLVLAALAVAAAALAYLAIPPSNAPPPPPQPRDTDTMRFNESPATAPPKGPDGLLPGVLGMAAGADGDASGLMLLQQGDEPFDGEPAGLARYPGPDATRVTGFRRRAAGYVQEFAFWRVKGVGVEEALAFYGRAAADAGLGTAYQVHGASNTKQVTKIYLPAPPGSAPGSGSVRDKPAGGNGADDDGGNGAGGLPSGGGSAIGGVRLTVGVTPVTGGVRIVLWSHRRAPTDSKSPK
jgi:hypothetical protein